MLRNPLNLSQLSSTPDRSARDDIYTKVSSITKLLSLNPDKNARDDTRKQKVSNSLTPDKNARDDIYTKVSSITKLLP